MSRSISKDLIREFDSLRTKIDREPLAFIDELLRDLAKNSEMISQHGQRANNIVQSMMMLSHLPTRERKYEDINGLVKLFANLAAHGRFGNEEVPVTIEKHLEEDLGQVPVYAQDLGRVLINLLNNAFDALSVKAKQLGSNFQPVITMTTRHENEHVAIIIHRQRHRHFHRAQGQDFRAFLHDQTGWKRKYWSRPLHQLRHRGRRTRWRAQG